MASVAPPSASEAGDGQDRDAAPLPPAGAGQGAAEERAAATAGDDTPGGAAGAPTSDAGASGSASGQLMHAQPAAAQPRGQLAATGTAGTPAAAAAQAAAAGLAPPGPAAARQQQAQQGPGGRATAAATAAAAAVPGCGAELVTAKGYYRRYRICQLHCSMASMQMDGREQRFCQQCGRFQDIGEFEGSRKSCRRKLKRHNERRRVEYVRESEEEEEEAQQEESEATEEREEEALLGGSGAGRRRRPHPARSASAGVAAGSAGGTAGSRGRAARSGSDAAVAAVAAAASGAAAAAAAAAASAAGLQQSLREGDAAAAAAAAAALPELPALMLPGPLGAAAGAAAPLLSVPIVAPQLLAAAQQQAQQRQAAQQQGQAQQRQAAQQQGQAQQAQQAQQQQQWRQGQGQEQQATSPVGSLPGMPDLQLPASNSPFYLELPSPFLGSTPTSGAAPEAAGQLQQGTLTMPRGGSGAGAGAPPAGLAPLVQRTASLQEQLGIAHAHSQATAAAAAAAAGAQLAARGSLAGMAAGGGPMLEAQGSAVGGAEAGAAAAVPAVAPLAAAGAGGAAAVPAEDLLVFNCAPDQLLPLVRAELERLTQASPAMLEGYIRPGCTHLTLSLLLAWGEAEGLLARGLPLRRWLAGGALGPLARHDMVVQFGGQLTTLRGGQVAAAIDLRRPPAGLAAAGLPRLASLHPFCVLAGQPGVVTLSGTSITGSRDLVLCRQQGRHLAAEFHGAGCEGTSGGGGGGGGREDPGPLQPPPAKRARLAAAPAGREEEGRGGCSSGRRQGCAAGRGPPNGRQPPEQLCIKPLGVLPGWVEVEVQRGCVLSEPLPLLALPCAAAVAEVRQLAADSAGICDAPAFLRRVGLVVQYLSRRQLAAAGHRVAPYPPATRQRIARMACQLAEVAAGRGWHALAALLHPAQAAAAGGERHAGGCCGSSPAVAPPAAAAVALPPATAEAAAAACGAPPHSMPLSAAAAAGSGAQREPAPAPQQQVEASSCCSIGS
ncbi:hypothetical protein CHLNCDRAFT_136650 [Chlorella variabilis]|uniref:SBP-type domain-containing protein n=1 Tax=Chlorella variabilis TaxID=554065 RepID=E1ZKR9_CHLVA|nr:hypothetical protein CHLNCDRAFT_136650 [Chlorella variabilis]EFN53428.1 hypothetical protein CHLNCDRAFT_136650 [Chlorella variabilis]|eukprot:XP_005845530.1 hypothetical protein CHLNCDRAFT_136650 [Chlorella variabilis]